MNFRSNLHFFAIVLCVLALITGATMGSKAGYLCLCGGTPVPTEAAFCEGPHSVKCVEAEAQSSGAGGSTSHEDSSNRREHQVVKKDSQLRAQEEGQTRIAPQMLLAILPMMETFFGRQEVKVPVVHPVDYGSAPPFGVSVARTVVLLI